MQNYQIKNSLQSIHNIVSQAKNLQEFGLNSDKIIDAAEQALSELFSSLEKLPWAEGCSKKLKTHCVLIDGFWYPSEELSLEPTSLGLVSLSFIEDDCVVNEVARFGRYAHIDAEGKPSFNYESNILEIMKYQPEFF